MSVVLYLKCMQWQYWVLGRVVQLLHCWLCWTHRRWQVHHLGNQWKVLREAEEFVTIELKLTVSSTRVRWLLKYCWKCLIHYQEQGSTWNNLEIGRKISAMAKFKPSSLPSCSIRIDTTPLSISPKHRLSTWWTDFGEVYFHYQAPYCYLLPKAEWVITSSLPLTYHGGHRSIVFSEWRGSFTTFNTCPQTKGRYTS